MTRRMPHIYSSDEIGRLLEAASRLRPRGAQSEAPDGYTTLIALLASTGLRISEALRLRLADITDDGLLIRATKFRKTCLVPLHDLLRPRGLQRYLMRRRQLGAGDDHVFCIGGHGGPLPYPAVHSTFQTLLRASWPLARPGPPSPALARHIRHAPLPCGHCTGPARQAEPGSDGTWSHWRPIWATSTSTRRTGT